MKFYVEAGPDERRVFVGPMSKREVSLTRYRTPFENLTIDDEENLSNLIYDAEQRWIGEYMDESGHDKYGRQTTDLRSWEWYDIVEVAT